MRKEFPFLFFLRVNDVLRNEQCEQESEEGVKMLAGVIRSRCAVELSTTTAGSGAVTQRKHQLYTARA